MLLRLRPSSRRQRPKFRCENWLALRNDFNEVCTRATLVGGLNWQDLTRSFKKEVRRWEALSKRPDTMLKEVEDKMIEL